MSTVVVMGAGAMGSWIGAALAQKHDVTLVSRPQHVAVVNAVGLHVEGKTTLHARPKAVLRARDAPVPDFLFITTKAYDTAQAIADAQPLLGQRTRVVSLQNGLGNYEAIAARADAKLIVAGATTNGVTFLEPGRVRHAGLGYLRLGSPSGERQHAEATAKLLNDVAIPAEVSDNPLGEIWAKVVVNAGINPITAITGLPNGALLTLAPLRELMERACEEAIDVARAEGIELPPDDLQLRARRVAELTADNKSSMLQDIEHAKRTEIDAISGEIVRRGLAHGVDTPVNLALRALVKGIEATTRIG